MQVDDEGLEGSGVPRGSGFTGFRRKATESMAVSEWKSEWSLTCKAARWKSDLPNAQRFQYAISSSISLMQRYRRGDSKLTPANRALGIEWSLAFMGKL